MLLTIWGTPGWANSGARPNVAPSDPRDLRDFAHALAARYSGRHPGLSVRPLLHGLERAERGAVPLAAVRRRRAAGRAARLRLARRGRLLRDQEREPARARRRGRDGARAAATSRARTCRTPSRRPASPPRRGGRARPPLRRVGAPSVPAQRPHAPRRAAALAGRRLHGPGPLRRCARALVRPPVRPAVAHRVRLPHEPGDPRRRVVLAPGRLRLARARARTHRAGRVDARLVRVP